MTEGSIHRAARRLYGDPGSASMAVLEELTSVFLKPAVPSEVAEAAGRFLRFFFFTPLAGEAARATVRLLGTPGLDACCYHALLRALRHCVSWRVGGLDVRQIAGLAACPHMEEHLNFLMGFAVEPLVLADPSGALPGAWREEARYLCYLLGKGGGGPLHEAVRRRLGEGPARVLAIHNINDGQGDEMVRLAPLLQSLLDFNPLLKATIVTRRLYLYDHPRVETVSIRDRDAIGGLLAGRFDAVIDFFEPVVPSVNYEPEVEPLVQGCVRRRKPFLFLSSLKGYHHFTYQTVAVDGRNLAGKLGLDRIRTGNIYDPTLRLLAELGLPPRIGEEKPRTECLLTGNHMADAERQWEALSGSGDRPVAMVNPFGGREALKGYTSGRFPALAQKLEAIIGEGYRVLLVPNGTAWGSASQAAEVAELVAPDYRRHLVVAPDPGQSADPDQTMRCFKYFVKRADLAVTVEGWMAHMAYLLGKPYRLLMLPYSHPFHWHPYPPGRNQRVEAWMAGSDPVRDLPGYPRKDHLLFVLGGLRYEETGKAVPALGAAMLSQDRHVREAAAGALASHFHDQRVPVLLVGALKDKSGPVRRIAAKALLEGGIDLSGELGEQYETILHCHCWIADGRWEDVVACGRTAFYPVCLAMDDENEVTRGEASWAFQRLTAGKFSRRS